MRYAMTVSGRVIDIAVSDAAPGYPPTNEGQEVVPIEISEDLELSIGLYYDAETGSFYAKEPDEVPPTQLDTIQEAVIKNEESQLIIMEALAEQYEESLERDLANMEAQATIYEAILEMGGNA